MTSPQHPQYHDPCRECRTQIKELNRVIDSLTYQIKGIAGENDDSSDENKRLTSKIEELESKLGDRERQFNELDGILESTRRLFLSSNEYAKELIGRISDLEHDLIEETESNDEECALSRRVINKFDADNHAVRGQRDGCRRKFIELDGAFNTLKKERSTQAKLIEELYEIIHDFRVGYGASRMFVDAVLIRNLNGDIAELKKEVKELHDKPIDKNNTILLHLRAINIRQHKYIDEFREQIAEIIKDRDEWKSRSHDLDDHIQDMLKDVNDAPEKVQQHDQELLDTMLKIVNPIIRSGEYSRSQREIAKAIGYRIENGEFK